MGELILKMPAGLAHHCGLMDGRAGYPARPEMHEAPAAYMKGYHRALAERGAADDSGFGDAA